MESSSNLNSSQIVFTHDDSLRDLCDFKPKAKYEESNLSDYPVDILSFDKVSSEFDIAQGSIFKGKRSGKIHNYNMDVDPGYEYIEKFRGGTSWHMTETEHFISNISFGLKTENGILVSINEESISFRLSVKEI